MHGNQPLTVVVHSSVDNSDIDKILDEQLYVYMYIFNIYFICSHWNTLFNNAR